MESLLTRSSSPTYHQGNRLEALSLREGELLFEVNESGKKMTIVGERVRYKYHHHHPQNGRVRQTLEPPCQGAEVPRLSTEFHAGQSR